MYSQHPFLPATLNIKKLFRCFICLINFFAASFCSIPYIMHNFWEVAFMVVVYVSFSCPFLHVLCFDGLYFVVLGVVEMQIHPGEDGGVSRIVVPNKNGHHEFFVQHKTTKMLWGLVSATGILWNNPFGAFLLGPSRHEY